MSPLIPLFTLAVLALGSCQLFAGVEPTADELPALRRAPRRWELRAQRPRDSYEEDQRAVHRSPPAPPAYSPAVNPFFQPVQVNVKLGGNEPGSVPVVVVPIPVPMHQPQSSGCDAVANRKQYNVNSGEVSYEELAPVQRPRGERPPASWKAHTSGLYDEEYAEPVSSSLGRRPVPGQPRRPQYRPREQYDQPREQQYDQPREQQYDQPREQPEQPEYLPAQPYEPDDKVDGVPPQFEPIASSQQLVEEFRAQTPKAPQLPPMLLSQFDGSERAPITDANQLVKVKAPEITSNDVAPKNVAVQSVVSSQSRSAPSLSAAASPSYSSPLGTNRSGRDPPRPRFDNLPMVRARLTVTPADYTEPYAVWFDQASGATRIDFHGGSTSTFRTMMPDGRVQRVEVRIDRSGEGTSRRCAVSVGARATPADRAHPALPDLQQFTFGGYEESPQGRVEVWRRTVSGRAGELGAARGEALTTRHELRLLREAGDRAMPLRYKVAVDSSVLGPDTDGYEHHYSLLQPEEAKPFDSKFFEVNMNDECDTTEQLNTSSSEDMARLEPLREFVLPHRDLRYDEVFRKFKEQFGRQYVDEKEEAVRKNIVIQSTRFVSAGNRQGSTAELGVNYLGDRLANEVRRLQGAEAEAERVPGEAFPHSRDDVRVEEKRLPSGFDWRQRGGVTPVRYQGECSSCWAFAVAGAVEGALFRVSRRLVALSEQSMVDCAQPFGGKGCGGTWPSHAYNYVEARGLPALEEYPSYKAKVGKCVDESVPSQTRISSHVNVTSLSVPALKVAIRRHAPSVVIVDADCKSFISYKSGILYDDRCGKTLRKLHHAVVAVGWGERQGEPYFILKNSWSDKWGKNGYIRVQARSNTCGVLTKPSYPRLEEPDVAQPLRKGARRQRTVHWDLDE